MRLFISILFFTAMLTGAVFAEETVLSAPSGADSSAAMHNEAGIKEYRSNNFGAAASHFSEAAAISPDFAEAHFNLALSLHKAGKHGEAKEHFKMARKHGDKNPAIKDSGLLEYHLGM